METLRYKEFEIEKNYLVIDSFNFLLIAAGASLNSQEEDAFQNIARAMTYKLLKMYPGYRVYACWDSAGGTAFRKDKSDSKYKSNRENHPKPVDIKELLKIKPFFESRGIVNVEIPATEGDDVIFVLCKAIREQNPKSKITIVTRDKDMIQVVQKGYATNIYDYTRKKDMDIPFYDIVMYKSLVGDPADCIPGVKGIGDKGAKKLISEAMVTGNLRLNEDQRKQYEDCLDLVDATRNPKYESNIEYIKSLGNL